MHQVCIPHYGPPEVLRLQEVPSPPLTPTSVRIDVRAIGINFADIMARQGLYPDCPKPPVVVGYEVAGTIESVGPEVTGFTLTPGQPVLALTRFGGYAEQVVVPPSLVFPLPPEMPFTHAAALPVNYLTAYLLLYVCGRLQAEERVLVHGAAGGVGLAAVQLGRLRQAEIYATASQPKHAFLQQQGVQHTLTYSYPELKAAVAAHTGGHGFDIVLDPHGGRSFAESYRLLAPLGRLMMFGVSRLSQGPRRHPLKTLWHLLLTPWFHPLRLLNDNKTVTGINLGHLWDHTALLNQAMDHLFELYQQHHIQPIISQIFPLSEAASAHQYIQNRLNIGKVLLTVSRR